MVQQVHHEALPHVFKKPNAAATVSLFAEQLVRPEVVVWIVERDGEALGYAMIEEIRRPETALTFAQSSLYVHHLAVVEHAQRRSVGRLLVKCVEDEGLRRGVKEVRLDYWTFNTSAQAFFASLGYEPYNERACRELTALT